jgi:hypothetical protein
MRKYGKQQHAGFGKHRRQDARIHLEELPMSRTMSAAITIVVVAAAAAAATAAQRAEYLAEPPVPGFTIGHQVARDGNAIVERVPAGETAQRWTRMVTTQRFAGASARMRPEHLLQTMGAGVVQACRGGRAGAIRLLTVSGRPAAQFRADCPMNPATGKPETVLARTIGGTHAMHVVQVAFRRVPTAQDISWAEKHLNGTMLCLPGSSVEPCASER